jgi:hypothetical protein
MIIQFKEDKEETKTEVIKDFEQPNSVKLSINAKLQYSAEIKVYARTPDEALKEACRIASSVETIIKEKNLKRSDLL